MIIPSKISRIALFPICGCVITFPLSESSGGQLPQLSSQAFHLLPGVLDAARTVYLDIREAPFFLERHLRGDAPLSLFRRHPALAQPLVLLLGAAPDNHHAIEPGVRG